MSYQFKVQDNSVGQPVWAVYNTTDSAWYNQIDLSFVSPNQYVFDVSDPSNNGYVLSFGTTVDVSDATIESTYVTRSGTPGTTNASVTLDLASYTGDALVYFEDSSAGMGYTEYVAYTTITESSVYNPDINSREFDGIAGGNGHFREAACQLDTTNPYGGVIFDATYIPNAWMRIDLPSNTDIAAVITQGSRTLDQWVTSYRLTYSTDNVNYYDIDGRTSWTGNSDRDTKVYHYFSSTVNARYIKIYPLTYYTKASFRAGLSLGTVDVVPAYAVTISNEAFYIDGSEKPTINFYANNRYIFDQSDPTNVGQQIVFGYHPDDRNHTFTASDGVTVVGTPGQPGAYTQLDLSSDFSKKLFYYSDASANLGFSVTPDATYTFGVQTTVAGRTVWAIYDASNSVWYNSPDLSFSAPNVYEFDMSDPTNDGFLLAFGDTVDVYDSSIENTYVYRGGEAGTANAKITLDLTNYSSSLVYFEDSSTNMGYTDYSANMGYSLTIVETGIYNPGISGRAFDGTTGYNGHPRENACQLDSTNDWGSWNADTNQMPNAWMEIRLSADTNIAGVITQGRRTNDQWVTSYRIKYSTDSDLTTYYDVDDRPSWNGNNDRNTKVYNYFSSTLTARYIRIYPLSYSGGTGLRAGLILGTVDEINAYAVTVSNEVLYLNGSANPTIDFSANSRYIFDQSDPSNDKRQIVFGYTDNDRSNILSFTDGVTIMGTAGQNGAYTELDLSYGFVGPLYYYSIFSPVDISYVVTAANGKYLLDGSANTQIEFAADTTYYFDESDSSNDGHELMFGRTVDNVTEFLGSSDGVEVFGAAGQPGAYTKLVLSSSFTGMIYYYCANHSGMGYTPTYNVLDTTTVTNAVSGDTATLTAVSTDDLTDTTVVGTTNASKRDYTKNLITQLISDNSSALSGKKLVLSGITLPGFSNVKNRDTIVVSANTNSSLNNVITKEEITNKNVYLIIEDNETFSFPTHNSTLTVTKTGDTTYDVSFSGVSTSYSSGDTFTQDGLTVVIGSVYATLESEVGNVDILLTHHLNESITASGLDIPDFTETMTADATVTCTGPAATVLQNTFYFQTNNDIATSETDDVYYFVDTSQWSTMSTDLNASTNGTISTADGAFIQGESISEYFLRHTANELFGTHLAVDLFNNETAVKSDITSKTAIVATNIVTAISNVGITGTDSDLSGAAYSKYLNDDVITSKNVSRELMNQLLDNDSSRGRFLDLSGIEMTPGVPGTYKIPFLAGDTLSYKVTIRPNVNQDSDVPTGGTTSERSFRVKMVLQ